MDILHFIAIADDVLDNPSGLPNNVVRAAASVAIASLRFHHLNTEFRAQLLAESVHTFLYELQSVYQFQVAALHNEKSSLVTFSVSLHREGATR